MKRFIFLFFALTFAAAAFAQSQTVRAFSHRGGRMERDENTLLAFKESWDAGYTGFETDVRMSKDGVLYITHDHTLDRTTNGTGVLEEMVAKAHKEGIIVSLWPGQSVEDFMLGVYLGCYYMCTDVPVKVKEWMTANAPWVKVIY